MSYLSVRYVIAAGFPDEPAKAGVVTYLRDNGPGKWWTGDVNLARKFKTTDDAEKRMKKIKHREPYLIEVGALVK